MEKQLFNPEDYDKDTCMSFESKEEYDLFCKYLDSIGRRWRSGDRYTEWSRFNRCELDTVLYFNVGSYGFVKRAVELGRIVLRYSDFYYHEDDAPSQTDYDVSLTFDQLFGF